MISFSLRLDKRVSTALPFAAFVWWLLAIPMNGPLLAQLGIDQASRSFLLPHASALALLGLFCPPWLFRRLLPAAVSLTIALSMAVALWPDQSPYFLPLLGGCGALVAIQACLLLRRSPAPMLSAAIGLIAANLLLIPLFRWPELGLWGAGLVSLPLLLILSAHAPIDKDEPPPCGLLHYLPFVLVFHMISGLMYAFIAPQYQTVAFFSGAELLFYMAAVLAAAWLIGKSRDLTLVCGIVLGMVAFALLQFATPVTVNLGMFAMQGAAGFVDLFLLAYLLSFSHPIRAFGLGQATLCFGIAAGQWLDGRYGDMIETMVFSIINLAVLTLYLLSRRLDEEVTVNHPTLSEAPVRISDNVRLLLSDREYLVLLRSLEGHTYRHTAAELEISESSVKTYMKRICDKLGVSSKKDLLKTLSGNQGST